jgi:DNA invertase Pin-like site-specific DNA recombinase
VPRYGYARAPTTDQDIAVRRETLEQVGCAAIREEKASGFSRQGRGRLGIPLTVLRPSDEHARGTGPVAIAAGVGLLRSTVWRVLRAKAAA